MFNIQNKLDTYKLVTFYIIKIFKKNSNTEITNKINLKII